MSFSQYDVQEDIATVSLYVITYTNIIAHHTLIPYHNHQFRINSV